MLQLTAKIAETDIIAKGGSVTLSLLANGTASGHLVIPASVAGSAFDQTLNGTWSVVAADERKIRCSPEHIELEDSCSYNNCIL